MSVDIMVKDLQHFLGSSIDEMCCVAFLPKDGSVETIMIKSSTESIEPRTQVLGLPLNNTSEYMCTCQTSVVRQIAISSSKSELPLYVTIS